MKALKFTALVLATAISSFYVAAQDEVMNVSLKNGKAAQYKVTEITDITFGEEVKEPATELNGHEYVDLGLPSGTKWATCNVGAYSPEDYGNCYGWGEYDTKGTYDIFKGKFCKYTFDALLESGVVNADGNLTAEYDVATKLWGDDWRIPSTKEFLELKECCIWTWVDNGDVVGSIVTGPNDKSIFIPAAGNYHGFQGEHGRYWTSTAYTKDDRSWAFYFDEEKRYITKDLRGTGIPVRPVAGGEEPATAVPAYVDLGLPNGTLWATCNIGSDYPTEYGDYYAWGETEQQDYNSPSYSRWYGKSVDELKELGVIDNAGNLTPQYDAATVNLGSNWRMPTSEEMTELVDNCTWEWTTINGRFCCVVTGPNGNSIVLVATGYRFDSELSKVIYDGRYWSSTVHEGEDYSNCLIFSNYNEYCSETLRYYGFNIRPVYIPNVDL